MRHPVLTRLDEALADADDQRLAASILGTTSPAAIGAALGALCRTHLGSTVVDVAFAAFSVGAAFGLVLDDRRPVFLKAWSGATSDAALDAVHTVQAALAARRFPAPGVLVRPVPFLAGRAAVLQWLDRGAQADAGDPGRRRAMAAALARLVALAAPYVDLPGLPRHGYPEGAVWGPAHNALFDFAATARGAAWIDEIAAASAGAARGGEGRLVVGHRDWSVKNLRFEPAADGAPAVSAVYDWDSLAVAREPEVVGMAAAAFTATWDIPVVRVFPTRAEMAAFVADYEAAAGRRFTAGEWRTAAAAATYLLAYTARCEHATSAAVTPDSARAILRECAAAGAARVFGDPADAA